jgi:hypothetical protein
MGVNLLAYFLIETHPLVLGQGGFEQLEAEFLLSLLQVLERGKLLRQLGIAELLHANLTTLVALRRIDVACSELRKKKSLGILDGFSLPLLCCRDAGVGHVEKVLEFLSSPESFKVRYKGTGVEVLECLLKD